MEPKRAVSESVLAAGSRLAVSISEASCQAGPAGMH